MCGRYFFDLEDTPAFLKLKQKIQQLALFEYATEEVFPTNDALVLLPSKEDYTLSIMKWGIDGYQKSKLINARSETIVDKKTFQPMLSNRCLIPCTGFFEWIKTSQGKQKVFIQKADASLFYLAGIYNECKEFVIVTGESQGAMSLIHTRTPIIIKEEQISTYLQKQLDFQVDNENLSFHHETKQEQHHEQLQLLDNEELEPLK